MLMLDLAAMGTIKAERGGEAFSGHRRIASRNGLPEFCIVVTKQRDKAIMAVETLRDA